MSPAGSPTPGARADAPRCVAVDLGGSKIAAARIIGEVFAERRETVTPKNGEPDALVTAVADLVAGWPRDRLGLAVTGMLQGGRLTAINPKTLPIPAGNPLPALLQTRLGVPVTAVNDAQAAAWGEYRFGRGRGRSRFAFITVSTGVGGGLVLDGRLQVGHGLAGHVGHLVADPQGPPCGCGRIGCVEAIASGRALAAAAAEHFGAELSVTALFDRFTHDPAARALIERSAGAVASLVADLKATLDLEAVAIGGGVGLAPGYVELVAGALTHLPEVFHVPIEAATLGADAGLAGVSSLVANDD